MDRHLRREQTEYEGTGAMSEYYKPNHAQMTSAVKGDDRYRPKVVSTFVLRALLLLLFLALWIFVFFVGLTGRG